MKDRNTDYNLLDLIEKSSKARQSQETPVQPKATEQVDFVVSEVNKDTATVESVDGFSLKITKPLAPVAVEAEPVQEETPVDRETTFPQKVGCFFKTLPGRTKDFFRNIPDRTREFFRTLPDRTKVWWQDFKPRFSRQWRFFWKYIHWQKVTNRIFTCLLYPLTLYLIDLASRYTAQIESLYSDGLNYVIRMVLNVVSSQAAFSISDVLTWGLIAVLVIALATTVYRLFTEKQGYRKWYAVIGFSSGLCVFLAVMFFVGQLFQGFNDYRKPLDQIMNMPIQQATTDELVSVCENLVYRAGEVREYLDEDDSGVVDIADRDIYLTSAAAGFTKGIRYFGNLTFQDDMAVGNLTLKASVAKFTNFSWMFNWMDRDGCYQPYTGEVLINKNVSDLQLPATINYYTAGQMGFTDPEACSFLAFMAGVNHTDPYYNYSSLMMGLSLVMERLYETDYAAWTAVRNSFTEHMDRDIAATEMFNWFAVGQGQEGDSQTITSVEGEASNHGMAVDLILSYYREGYMKDIHVGVWQSEVTTDATRDVTTDLTTDITSDAVTD